MSGFAGWERAVVDLSGSQSRGGGTQRAGLAGGLDSLGSVGAHGAGLALALDGELLAGAALVSALLARDCLGGSGGLAQAADLAGEAALLGLVEAVAAGPAGFQVVVVVLAGTAALLAVLDASGSGAYRHRRPARGRRALLAGQLARL